MPDNKKIAIVQSNYIPWKGYFDLIAAVDEFILYDDMQFTRRDWRNRNKIKTPQGTSWLTIPVKVKGRYQQKIKDTVIDSPSWASKHMNALKHNYRFAPFYDEINSWLQPHYDNVKECTHLSQVNRFFIEAICKYLGIDTVISDSWSYRLSEGKSERLADLCVQAGGNEYLSGPAARCYTEESFFNERGICLTWFDYSGYPKYPQLWGDFTHEVTVLDLLYSCGKSAPKYMRYVM